MIKDKLLIATWLPICEIQQDQFCRSECDEQGGETGAGEVGVSDGFQT